MAQLKDDSLLLAKLCARLLDEQKMEDIKIFDVRESINITDYFVIATGRNSRHLQAASEKLQRELREVGVRGQGLEGFEDAKWILIDLADVVAHLFLQESRKFYDLELLWGDSPLIEWNDEDRSSFSVA